MRFQVEQADFLKGIQTTYPAIPSRSTLPILSHILLEARKDRLQLAGTDLELGIIHSLKAEVLEEGAITVPAKRLLDLVKELPSLPFLLYTKKNQQLSIESQQGIFKILCLPKEEFPHLPTPETQGAIVMDQGVLQAMLELTTFAVSQDESRYVLTGVLFLLKDRRLRLVATDGRRLALVEREPPSAPPENQQAIVPLKAIQELHRLCGQGPTVKVFLQENQATFDLGETQVISRLIEGKFPNYEQVIPQEAPQKLTISREEFLLATRRISLWATQDSPSIRLDLKPDHLILSKQTPEVGEAQEKVKGRYSGTELSIGFNPDYLTDVLKALPDGEVEFELPGPDRPGVIRTKDHYLYIVLPMQLSS